ncbi:MAG: hypothetical protein WCJ36_02930 [Candidatus Saccharibacteria bacterium]
MIEINLVPDVKQELIKAQRIRSAVITVSIAVCVVSIAAVILLVLYIYTVQAVRSGIADNSIKQGNSQLGNVKDLSKTLTIQNQLTKISALNSSKKIDSRIFDLLSAVIPPSPNDVKFSNLAIDSTAKTISIDGQAANSYAALEIFKKTIGGTSVKYDDGNGNSITTPIASNISIKDVSYGQDSSGVKVLRFTISFTYDEAVFAPSSKNLSFIVTINGDVTDSYLGVPTFVDRAKDLTGGQ